MPVHEKGFTLIEIAAIVIVIAILAAIAIPNLASMQDRAKEATVLANAHNVLLAVETYKAANGGAKPTGFTTAVAYKPNTLDRFKYYMNAYSAYAKEVEDNSNKEKEQEKEKNKGKEKESNGKGLGSGGGTTPTTPATTSLANIPVALYNPYNKANAGPAAITVGTGSNYTPWSEANKGQVCYDYNPSATTNPFFIAGQGKSGTIIRLTEGQNN